MQLALEILTGVCATLPDPDLDVQDADGAAADDEGDDAPHSGQSPIDPRIDAPAFRRSSRAPLTYCVAQTKKWTGLTSTWRSTTN